MLYFEEGIMKSKRRTEPYERRLYSYSQEKQELLSKNPFLTPKERDEAIRKLADKWKI